MYNKVIIIGNLGQDPETRATSSGSVIANLSVATQRSVKRDDKWEQETEWHKVVVFGQPAEFVSQYAKKGRLVMVEGRIQTRHWNDKDGVKRYSTEIVADQVKLLGPATTEGGASAKRDEYKKDAPDDDLPF